MKRILDRNQLHETAEQLRGEGKKIVTTNGCFDILHIGHTRFLERAKELGDVLIVGINTDASVRRLKGSSRPINSQHDRAEVVAALRSVDYVTLFDEDTPVEYLSEVKPHVHAKGADYKPSDLAETPVVESFGGKVHIIELIPDKSTTRIVNKLSSNQAP
jgi:glycerol-3-phosphate cytidylyltransferase